jgi:hypothetical protein
MGSPLPAAHLRLIKVKNRAHPAFSRVADPWVKSRTYLFPRDKPAKPALSSALD